MAGTTYGRDAARIVRRLYPHLLLGALIAGVAVGMAIGGPELTLLGLATVGPPFLIGAVVLFGVDSDALLTDSSRVTEASVPNKLYVFGVTMLFAGCVFAAVSQPTRPLSFFVLLGALYLTMFAQIRDGEPSSRLVLAEITAVLALAIYSVTLNYGLYFGGTDTLLHIRYAEITYQTGSTLAPSVSDYAYFPLYHVFVAQGMHVFGSDSALATFLLTPLPLLAAVPFVYKIADHLLSERTDALTAALLFSLLPNVVYYGQYMVTRVMAFTAFVMIVYLLYLFVRQNRPHSRLLLSVASLFLLLVHQVSALQVLGLLGLLAAAHWAVGDDSEHLWKYVAVLGALVALYWGVVATDFAYYLITSRLQGIGGGSTQVTGGGGEALFNHPTFYANQYVFVLLALLGIGAFVASDSRNSRIAVGLFALVAAPLYIPNPLHALWEAIRLFRLDRFLLLLTPFSAILMAAGLRTLSTYTRRATGRSAIASVAIFLAVGLFALTATTSSVAPVAADSADVEWAGPPLHFDEGELDGFEHVDSNTAGDATVYADWHTSRYFAGVNEKRAALAGERKYDVEPIMGVETLRESSGEPGSYVIVREQRLREEGLAFGNGVWYTYDPTDENVEAMNAALRDRGQVYDNGDVTVRVSPSEE